MNEFALIVGYVVIMLATVVVCLFFCWGTWQLTWKYLEFGRQAQWVMDACKEYSRTHPKPERRDA